MALLSSWRAKKHKRKKAWSIIDELDTENRKPKWWQVRRRLRRRWSDP